MKNGKYERPEILIYPCESEDVITLSSDPVGSDEIIDITVLPQT